MIKEFYPSILFLVKFVGLYLVLNLLYGVYVNSYAPQPDPATIWVSNQTGALLGLLGYDTSTSIYAEDPSVWLNDGQTAVISVYEGCNGLNVMVIFVSFLLAFGKPRKELLWFIPLGLLIIHLMNLFRVGLLFNVSLSFPDFMYFFHKYFFTAILYVVVFILWWYWVTRILKRYKTDEG